MPRPRCIRVIRSMLNACVASTYTHPASCRAGAAKSSPSRHAAGVHDAETGGIHCLSVNHYGCLWAGTYSSLWVDVEACTPVGLLQLRYIFGEANPRGGLSSGNVSLLQVTPVMPFYKLGCAEPGPNTPRCKKLPLLPPPQSL